MSDVESSSISNRDQTDDYDTVPESAATTSSSGSTHTVSPMDALPRTRLVHGHANTVAPSLPPVNNHFLGSESVILAFLFGSIALLLPAFFYFVSSRSAEEDQAGTGLNVTLSALTKTPLATVVSYLPTISAVIYQMLSKFKVVIRAMAAMLSLTGAALAPVTIVLNLILQVFVLGPIRLTILVVQFFYPLYVLIGVAGLLGAGVGVFGRGLIYGGRILLANASANTQFPGPLHDRKGKKKAV